MATDQDLAHSLDSLRSLERKKRTRSSPEYQLIFFVCLLNFMVTGLIERLNPFYWVSRRAGSAGATWWTQARDAALRCSSMSFKG